MHSDLVVKTKIRLIMWLINDGCMKMCGIKNAMNLTQKDFSFFVISFLPKCHSWYVSCDRSQNMQFLVLFRGQGVIEMLTKYPSVLG